MLPFLKKKDEVGSIALPDAIERKPDENKEEDFDSLESAMDEIHSALQSKDYKSAAQIFRSAFELLDSEPHHEGEHI